MTKHRIFTRLAIHGSRRKIKFSNHRESRTGNIKLSVRSSFYLR